ncbi:Aldose 1-epimerase [Sesamum angolense]|uniref:Aldose 1-epimerase n=1 Tax=Sesamum angolense TaxID=2727404 RepID=A0AAE1WGV3_9LAMI|nr:Aldose 1-epimerase [Sesamum angolense]
MSKISILFCFIVLAFGISANGSENGLGIYEIKKGDFSVKVTNYGARILSVVLPDKNGKLADVVLGYDTIKEYMNDTGHFGAIVGRVANRIGGAKFTLNGTLYKLDANEGNNTLHGGKKGFSEVAWKVTKHVKYGRSPYITLSYHSVDGEEGIMVSGDVLASVTYALIEPYKLSVTMKAKALNKATPVSLAQHSYWNLGGHNSGNILSDELQLFASHITLVDDKLIPTGKIVPVKSTPYDFLEPHVIKGPISQLPKGSKGYDINYVVDGPKGQKMKPVAVVYNKKSGRIMKSANAPGVQLYTDNYISDLKGKGGYVYQSHAALCLETQGFPDSVNHPNFPSQIVNPGKTYEHSNKSGKSLVHCSKTGSISQAGRRFNLLRALLSQNIMPNGSSYRRSSIEAAIGLETRGKKFYISCQNFRNGALIKEIYICLDANGHNIIHCPYSNNPRGCGTLKLSAHSEKEHISEQVKFYELKKGEFPSEFSNNFMLSSGFWLPTSQNSIKLSSQPAVSFCIQTANHLTSD